MERFSEFKISSNLVKDLESHGIVNPTVVQEKVIPLVLTGKDVLVQSETGSGKTIGFAVPTIELIEKTGKVNILVIAPTRELAKQISEEFEKFSKTKGLRTATVYGGVSIDKQIFQVRTADIVVGTPGRILDLLERRVLNLTYVKYFVMDEADRMLDMGFIDDINNIIRHLPKEHHSMMFSATVNNRIIGLAEKYMKSPEKIILENVLKPGILKQCFYNTNDKEKLPLLVSILKKLENPLVLVFCNTKYKTRFVADTLRLNGVKAECLNGDMTQFMRENALKNFAEGKTKVLVATDIAARGIHVEDITHVINYDLSDLEENYIHRIGRTARNGKKGTAIILFTERDWVSMDRVMKKHGADIEELKYDFLDIIRVAKKDSGRRDSGRRNFGRRDSGRRDSGRRDSRPRFTRR